MNLTALSPHADSRRALQSMSVIREWIRSVARPSLVQLVLRLALAVPFWKSGLLKWSGFLELSDNALTLFTDTFQLHLPGGPYPYPAPVASAFAAGCLELVLPVLLLAGLGTRLAAATLLAMTLVIQLTVPDGWPVHLTWAAMALALMAYGAGPVSIDHLLVRRWTTPPSKPR